jgi:hypothetical protein
MHPAKLPVRPFQDKEDTAMTDKEVDQEVRENIRRKEENQREQEDDGTLIDTLEEVVTPITEAIGREPLDEEELHDRARANDADQR